MKYEHFQIEDLLLITPDLHRDDRGYFMETYNEIGYCGLPGFSYAFVQDNLSFSRYGTIRGLHYQKEPYPQTKLVRCVSGRIWDVAVDIRSGSPTFGKYVGLELNSDLHQQFLIPRGFAHGFSVLTPEAIVEYKCDAYYSPQADAGIRFNDPELAIDWKIDPSSVTISARDARLPLIKELSGR